MLKNYCPKCGKKDIVYSERIKYFSFLLWSIKLGKIHKIFCKNCGYQTDNHKTYKDAERQWNKGV